MEPAGSDEADDKSSGLSDWKGSRSPKMSCCKFCEAKISPSIAARGNLAVVDPNVVEKTIWKNEFRKKIQWENLRIRMNIAKKNQQTTCVAWPTPKSKNKRTTVEPFGVCHQIGKKVWKQTHASNDNNNNNSSCPWEKLGGNLAVSE